MTQHIDIPVSTRINLKGQGDLTALRNSNAAVLTRTDVARLFGVDPRSVTAAIQSGQLPSVHVGRRVFIPRVPLLALLLGDAE